jgi:hypothetical protein
MKLVRFMKPRRVLSFSKSSKLHQKKKSAFKRILGKTRSDAPVEFNERLKRVKYLPGGRFMVRDDPKKTVYSAATHYFDVIVDEKARRAFNESAEKRLQEIGFSDLDAYRRERRKLILSAPKARIVVREHSPIVAAKVSAQLAEFQKLGKATSRLTNLLRRKGPVNPEELKLLVREFLAQKNIFAQGEKSLANTTAEGSSKGRMAFSERFAGRIQALLNSKTPELKISVVKE